jgi:hypothetical protein
MESAETGSGGGLTRIYSIRLTTDENRDYSLSQQAQTLYEEAFGL